MSTSGDLQIFSEKFFLLKRICWIFQFLTHENLRFFLKWKDFFVRDFNSFFYQFQELKKSASKRKFVNFSCLKFFGHLFKKKYVHFRFARLQRSIYFKISSKIIIFLDFLLGSNFFSKKRNSSRWKKIETGIQFQRKIRLDFLWIFYWS